MKHGYNPARAAVLRCHRTRAVKAHPVTRVPLKCLEPDLAPEISEAFRQSPLKGLKSRQA